MSFKALTNLAFKARKVRLKATRSRVVIFHLRTKALISLLCFSDSRACLSSVLNLRLCLPYFSNIVVVVVFVTLGMVNITMGIMRMVTMIMVIMIYVIMTMVIMIIRSAFTMLKGILQ